MRRLSLLFVVAALLQAADTSPALAPLTETSRTSRRKARESLSLADGK